VRRAGYRATVSEHYVLIAGRHPELGTGLPGSPICGFPSRRASGMTSTFGALLTAGYASAMGAALAGTSPRASQITAAAQSSFLQGDQWAYLAAMIAVVIGMALVFRFFPTKERENELRLPTTPGTRGRTGRDTRARLNAREAPPVAQPGWPGWRGPMR